MPAPSAGPPPALAALQAERPPGVRQLDRRLVHHLPGERAARRCGPRPIQAAFAAATSHLKGDWTNGDAAIGALLREHGREGVPLYLLYPAGGGPPALLPQVLTEGIVLRALDAPG